MRAAMIERAAGAPPTPAVTTATGGVDIQLGPLVPETMQANGGEQ